MHKKKLLRKIMILALAGIMTFGMSANVFAAKNTASNYTNSNTNDAEDTKSINLIKDYVKGSDSQSSTSSPAETFTFKIENYGLWNVGENGNGQQMYDVNSMPKFDETNTIIAAEGDAEKSDSNLTTSINVPTYKAVGDYWYKVTETDNNTAGVLYGTNDSETENTTAENGAHNGVYYIHVQVTNGNKEGEYIRTVTLHKTAPDTNINNTKYEKWYSNNNTNGNETASVKVNDIRNKYYAGSLEIKKTVTGNAGDKNELFKVTVEFTNDSGANMNSDITYKNFYDKDGKLTDAATSLNWSSSYTSRKYTNQTKSVDFYVKDGTTVTFDNIPYGVSYKITETQPDDDKYTHEFKYDSGDTASSFNGVNYSADEVTAEDNSKTDDEKWSAASATGSISDDSDTVTITNTRESVIDIGVVTNNAPYIAMLILAGAAAFVYVRRRKDLIEE